MMNSAYKSTNFLFLALLCCVGNAFANTTATPPSVKLTTQTPQNQDEFDRSRPYDFAKVIFNKPKQHNPNEPAIALDPDSLLKAVNTIRSRVQRCGAKLYRPAPTLKWNNQLATAATAHAQDMATHNYFEHTDRLGQTVVQRTKRAGYPSEFVGENLGAGYPTANAALRGWLASTSHCDNLMYPYYTEVGIGFAYNPKSRWGRYWVMNLGGEQLVKIIYIYQ